MHVFGGRIIFYFFFRANFSLGFSGAGRQACRQADRQTDGHAGMVKILPPSSICGGGHKLETVSVEGRRRGEVERDWEGEGKDGC